MRSLLQNGKIVVIYNYNFKLFLYHLVIFSKKDVAPQELRGGGWDSILQICRSSGALIKVNDPALSSAYGGQDDHVPS